MADLLEALAGRTSEDDRREARNYAQVAEGLDALRGEIKRYLESRAPGVAAPRAVKSSAKPKVEAAQTPSKPAPRAPRAAQPDEPAAGKPAPKPSPAAVEAPKGAKQAVKPEPSKAEPTGEKPSPEKPPAKESTEPASKPRSCAAADRRPRRGRKAAREPQVSRTVRLASIAAILLAIASLLGVARWQAARARRASDTEHAWSSPEDCRDCHREVWSEWESSGHRRAWSDPRIQASFQHFGFDRKCETCHAPEPLLVLGLETPPEVRAGDRENGVDCLSCHMLPDGRIAATRTVSAAPCQPVETSALRDVRFCGVCHTAIAKDWEELDAPDRKSCGQCHMPAADRSAAVRSHVCLGGHDDASVRSAVRIACRRQADELVVSVSNVGADHNFPGERHNRLLLLEVVEEDPSGQTTLVRREVIKGITPFRGESSAEAIRARRSVELRFPAIAPGTATVRLLYKRFPWHADEEALVVCEERIQWKH